MKYSVILACFLLFFVVVPLHAQVINGDFSDGSTGWTASSGVDFSNGYAVMSIIYPDSYVSTTTTLSISQTVYANPGDTLSFDAIIYGSMKYATCINTYELYNTSTKGIVEKFVGCAQNESFGSTSWTHYTLTIPADFSIPEGVSMTNPFSSGYYSIRFIATLTISSYSGYDIDYFAVDNVQVTPEPSSVIMLIVFGACITAWNRRQRKSASF